MIDFKHNMDKKSENINRSLCTQSITSSTPATITRNCQSVIKPKFSDIDFCAELEKLRRTDESKKQRELFKPSTVPALGDGIRPIGTDVVSPPLELDDTPKPKSSGGKFALMNGVGTIDELSKMNVTKDNMQVMNNNSFEIIRERHIVSPKPHLTLYTPMKTVFEKDSVVKKGLLPPALEIIDMSEELEMLRREEEIRKKHKIPLQQRILDLLNQPVEPDEQLPTTNKIKNNNVTPMKSVPETEHIFATPKPKTKLGLIPELDFITPKPDPMKAKIQCRIDMSSALRTPVGLDVKPKFITSASAVVTPLNLRKSAEKENTPPEVSAGMFDSMVINKVTYIILNQLGRGGSSVVYHGYNTKVKKECAIKCVDLQQDALAVEGYINEVKMLDKLQNCSRIIKLYSYEKLEEDKKLMMVLEKGGKDLSQILKELALSSEHLPYYMLMYYWMEMLQAVKEIHESGVIHSDLKPANFLQANGKIKLIDFGIASSVQIGMTSVVKNVALGTFSYISPEALQSSKTSNCDSPNYGKPKYKISYRSDVWSLGCILYQLVYRQTPFQHIKHTWAKLSAIMDPKHVINYPPAPWVPPEIIDTIKHCLIHDMKSRATIDQLINQNLKKNYY